MATRKYTNNGATTILAAVTNSQTGVTLASGGGALFPTLTGGDWFVGTLSTTAGTVEIVKVTARATDYLTVTRGQESTSGTAFAAGSAFQLRPTAASFTLASLPTSFVAGDVVYASNTTSLVSLAIGAANRPLTSTGTLPQWDDKLEVSVGGTGLTTYAKGDLLYASTSTPTLAKLPISATAGHLLQVVSGLPAWGALVPPRSYLAGLGTSLAADTIHDISIAAGSCVDGTNAVTMDLAAALIKQIDAAWAVGTNAGGFDTGAVGNSTWYALWLIKRADTGVVDALYSASFSAPTMPTNYTLKRRIGAVLTDGSAQILAYTQVGDDFTWTTPILDVSNDVAEAATLRTLSVPPVGVVAILNVNIDFTGADIGIYLSPVAATDSAPSSTGLPGETYHAFTSASAAFGLIYIRADTSRQIRSRTAGTLDALDIITLGWHDRRGRDD